MPSEMADIADDFEEFWTISNRRVKKGYARLEYVRARRKASKEAIHEAYKLYCFRTRGEEPHWIAHPSSWLRGERWLDEEDSEVIASNRQAGRGTPAEQRLHLARGNLARAALGK